MIGVKRCFMELAINSTRSSQRDIPGSVLSPLMHSLFISYFKNPRNTEIVYYADYTGLITDAKQTRTKNQMHQKPIPLAFTKVQTLRQKHLFKTKVLR